MKVHVLNTRWRFIVLAHNTSPVRWKRARISNRHNLYWVGPLFVSIHPSHR